MSYFQTFTDNAEEKEEVVTLLRAELQEYGGLLQLLEDQQNAILQRASDTVLTLNGTISAQVETIQARRQARERFVEEVASDLRQPKGSALRELLRHFRAPIQPLIEALIDEINRLVKAARRRAEQNQLLLTRSIEVLQDVLARLNPEAMHRVYGADGRSLFGVRERGGRCLARS